MGRTTKFAAVIGAGLAAGVLSAGPAMASTQVQRPPHDDSTVGFFRSESDCRWVGYAGQQQGRWGSPHCDPSDYGQMHFWRLWVDRMGASTNSWPGDDNDHHHHH